MENWSNNACLGYVIKSLENLEYSEEEIKKVTGEMNYLFDTKTVTEAADIYCNSTF